ncbi:hypothetical protein KFE25_001590 [Diacronema lutheri]|uniref:Rab-GAP TBC domain-containing protein n=1 Tax=Diacronema lutheri TaxID=2081491 RepID=A0A8J6C5P5_DIALT|nr:hypothetical protein KFE25_001590 [Diacronema lutheri]
MASCPHADVWRLAPAHSRAALRRHVHAGIPAHARAQLWRVWTGAEEGRAATARLYAHLVARGEGALRDVDAALLRADLPRTPVPEGVPAGALCRLLRAFVARRDLDLGGYTQGMNFLGAFLLHALRDEVSAFAALLRVSETVALFSHDLAPLSAELRALRALVGARLPELSAKLADVGLPLEAFAARWFLCCGLGALRADAAASLWDALLYEEWVAPGGGLAVLHAASIALLARRAPRALDPFAGAFDVAELLSTAGDDFDARAVLDALYAPADATAASAHEARAAGGAARGAHAPPLAFPAACGCGCAHASPGALCAPICPEALALLRASAPPLVHHHLHHPPALPRFGAAGQLAAAAAAAGAIRTALRGGGARACAPSTPPRTPRGAARGGDADGSPRAPRTATRIAPAASVGARTPSPPPPSPAAGRARAAPSAAAAAAAAAEGKEKSAWRGDGENASRHAPAGLARAVRGARPPRARKRLAGGALLARVDGNVDEDARAATSLGAADAVADSEDDADGACAATAGSESGGHAAGLNVTHAHAGWRSSAAKASVGVHGAPALRRTALARHLARTASLALALAAADDAAAAAAVGAGLSYDHAAGQRAALAVPGYRCVR